MAGETSQSALPRFPDALETCLREDAIIRADARLLQRQQEEIRATAAQAREATALPGRLLAAFGRRKGGPTTPEEAAEIFARENVLERQTKESVRLQEHWTARLDAQLRAYLETAVPVFRQQSRARVELAAWERTIEELRADLRELLKMLGQARNNAVAGYDRKTNRISFTAREMFAQSRGLISQVEAHVRRANEQAAETGVPPRVAIIPLQETINALLQHEIGTMLREFDRVVRELELFEQRQLVDLQVPAVAAADALVAQARDYLVHYREQLRAHYDQQVTPDEIREAIPGLLDRFRRGAE